MPHLPLVEVSGNAGVSLRGEVQADLLFAKLQSERCQLIARFYAGKQQQWKWLKLALDFPNAISMIVNHS